MGGHGDVTFFIVAICNPNKKGLRHNLFRKQVVAFRKRSWDSHRMICSDPFHLNLNLGSRWGCRLKPPHHIKRVLPPFGAAAISR